MAELASGDPRHGTYNGYHNHGCRCNPCRIAHSAQLKAYAHRSGRHRPREVYYADLRTNPPAHGTESRYTAPHNCRCDQCKKASREARAKRRAKVAA